MGFCCYIGQVINVWCGRMVIRDGVFYVNYMIDNCYVFFYGICNGVGRDMISVG